MRAFFYWLAQEANVFTWFITIGLDLLWNFLDGLSIFSGIGILCYPVVMVIIFGACFVPVLLIQHFANGDEWNTALKKGAIFGLIAAMPFSVVTLIAGAVGLGVKQSRGRDYEAAFGRFSINYRELEKTVKRAACSNGVYHGGWREITMETAINTLERSGKVTASEAHELHKIRIARNYAHHEENPANLAGWVGESARLLEKYQRRFSAYAFA